MKPLFSIILFTVLALPATSRELAVRQATPPGDRYATIDSVTVRRHALTTAVYHQGEKLSYRELKSLYGGTPAAAAAQWVQPMRIAAPVLAAGGIALGTVALKGTPETAVIQGKTYEYTTRSKPKLAAGLVLLAGGLCLFEWSNDLLVKSARLYNWDKIRKSRGMKAGIGITGDGVGLIVGF